jgi:hypothetical protein
MRFLENRVVLTVKEGEISPAEIVENLQRLFDPGCPWQLKEVEGFKYLVRFLPQKKIADTLISDVTYFKMNKIGILVSLRAWNGDIEHFDSLDEFWIQMSGVPPKWSTWKTLQIATSLGNLLEVDWSSVSASFFGMVRLKIACKDATKNPKKSHFEMQKNIPDPIQDAEICWR